MKSFFQQRIAKPLLGFLQQGVSPHKLALAVTLGIVIATIPAFGTCTVLCLAAIWLFKINPAAILLVNQLAFPLQFACYFPLIRLGEWTFNQPPLPLSLTEILELISTDLFLVFQKLWWSTVFGVTVWMVLALPIGYFLYGLLRFVFSRMNKNRTASETMLQ